MFITVAVTSQIKKKKRRRKGGALQRVEEEERCRRGGPGWGKKGEILKKIHTKKEVKSADRSCRATNVAKR